MALEDTLRAWAQRPSSSEQDRIDRTERMIREAISKSGDPRVSGAKVFAKGSVKMNTNIRATSDIDICVQASDVFFTQYPEGTDNSTFGNHNVDYSFQEFRRNVELALTNHFGLPDVDATGNKAIRIRNTISSSRVEADVIPAFVHRRYSLDGDHIPGIEIIPKKGGKVINWPHHNYENSLAKHEDTARRYRKMVRILKRTREAMNDSGSKLVHDAQSFLIESILWNVPNDNFGFDRYEDDLKSVISYLKLHLSSAELVKEWGEVNELKYLFGNHQKWSREGALAFVNNADRHLDNL